MTLPDKLWHYTAEPFVIEPRSYEQDEPNTFGKPRGFWVSVEGEYDWPSWCRAEEFGLDRLSYRSPVSISGNILYVGPDEMTAFEQEFSVLLRRFITFEDRAIDWRKVADRYDGIIIAPYSWEHRLDARWYYTWDCASGCIWNLDAITVGESEPHPLPERVYP